MDKPVIYTLDYCHGDFSWTNPRSWHIERYISSICAALDDTEKHKTYCYLFDNYAHQLEVFFRYCPERASQFKKACEEGRLIFAGGGWALGRPGFLQAEAYVRNMLAGKKALSGFTDCVRFFFNADTAGGHSQMPQILSSAGYDFYMFYRPEKLLNGKNIPKQFIWRGADGSEIVVNRGYYGTLAYDRAFAHGTPYKDALAAFGEDFSQQAEMNETGLYFMPAGCDDVIPGMGICDVPSDMSDFMRDFSASGDGKLFYGTPEQFFDELGKLDLPVHIGKLYDCELSYNIPYKSPAASLYPRRHKLAYKLLALERLAAVASMNGVCFDDAVIGELWIELHEISGHAQECAIWDDLSRLLGRADAAILCADRLYFGLLDELAGKVCGEGEYLIFYPAQKYEGSVCVEVTSAFGASPDGAVFGGGSAPAQVIAVNRPDKKYSSFDYSAVRALVPVSADGIGFETFCFTEGKISEPKKVRSAINERMEISAGVLTLTVSRSGIVKIEGNGVCTEGMFGTISSRSIPLSETWLPEFHFGQESLCRFKYIETEYDGELSVRFKLTGKLRNFPCSLTVTADKKSGRLDFEASFVPDGKAADYSAVFPLENGRIKAGIPYGVEDRTPETDVSSDDYEQNLPGNIYSNGFMSFPCGGTNAVLATSQGHKLMQADGDKLRLLLRHNPGSLRKRKLPTEQWMTNQYAPDGVNVFTWSVAFSLDDVGSAAFYESVNMPPAAVKNHRRGSKSRFASFKPFEIDCGLAVVTAFYKEEQNYYLRLYEAAGKTADLKITAPFEHIDSVRLDGKACKRQETLNPYQIVTLRMSKNKRQ